MGSPRTAPAVGRVGPPPPQRRRRGRGWAAFLLCVGLLSLPTSVAAGARGDGEWVEHRVLFGERLAEIADRHGVSVKGIIRWNKLNPKRPRIRAGQDLRIYSRLSPPPRKKVIYTVRRGDSWAAIANRYGVDRRKLRRHWNRRNKRLRAGEEVIVWVDGEVEAPDAGPPPPDSDLPVKPVATTAFSVGRPDRGRLTGGIRLPDNPALYTIRNPGHAYASSHTLMQLQLAIARFRDRSGYDGPLVIHDMSKRRGGRLRPHRSHRSGRDVDIRLPSRPHVPPKAPPILLDDVDWDAAWQLLSTLLDTGEVVYIFLSRTRQRALHAAARRAGVDEEKLATIIEYPRHGGPVPIRHARGHTKHFHVRFKCAEWEKRCRD